MTIGNTNTIPDIPSLEDLDTPTATRAYGGRPQRYTSVRFGTCITDILSSDVGTLGFSHTAVNVFDELLTRCCKQIKARRTRLMNATVSVSQASIARRRGLSKSQVHYAILELAGYQTVQPEKGKRITSTEIVRQPVIKILEQTSRRSASGAFKSLKCNGWRY